MGMLWFVSFRLVYPYYALTIYQAELYTVL